MSNQDDLEYDVSSITYVGCLRSANCYAIASASVGNIFSFCMAHLTSSSRLRCSEVINIAAAAALEKVSRLLKFFKLIKLGDSELN